MLVNIFSCDTKARCLSDLYSSILISKLPQLLLKRRVTMNDFEELP